MAPAVSGLRMTTSDAVLGKPRVTELAPALAILAAWAALLLAARGQQQGAGMDMASHPANVWASAAAGLPSWMLMTVAMMGPAALARFRYVGRAAARPVRELAGFVVAYLAVWAAFGFLAQAIAAAIPGVPGPAALALTLLAAAAWQLTPVKRHLLRRHKNPGQEPASSPLAGGARYGLCCVGACWSLMLVMVAAPTGQLLWLAGLTILITAERVFPNLVTPSAGAAALGVAAVATLAVAGLL